MIQSLIRILILGVLGYGIYRAVPAVVPVVEEGLGRPEITNLSVIKKSQDYIKKISGGGDGDDVTSSTEDDNKIIDDLIEKAKESVAEKVQEDVDKAKEGVKDVANEQFCKTILKTLEEECGKYYCSE